MAELLKKTDSKDPLRNFMWNRQGATVFPNFSFDACISMVDNDPVARGALTHFVDKCMEGDYAIVYKGKDEDEEGSSTEYDEVFELLLDKKYKFRTDILRKIFLLGKLFNNVFIEIVRTTDGETKSLNVVDPYTIEPVTLPNGDLIKYVGKIPDPTNGKYPEWSKDDMVWIKFGDRSAGYAPVDMRAIYENLLSKEYITRYVAWLWKTGQYRIIYNFKDASDQNVESFLAYARKHDENFKAPFLTKGEFQATLLRDMKEIDSLEKLLKYYDNQTLILMRVPPIDAGVPDASGRSNSDAQSNNFITHVTSFKKVVEDAISFDLFPKINKSNNALRFAPMDRFSEKQVWEIVNIMKNIGMTPEFIEEYLQDKGMFYKCDELFVDPMEMLQKQASMIPGQKKDINTMNSRLKSVDKNKVGTGKESSTRDDQLAKQ